MPKYALVPFKHHPLELDVKRGDELPDNHEMVELRPDLFADAPPKKRAPRKPAAAAKKSAKRST